MRVLPGLVCPFVSFYLLAGCVSHEERLMRSIENSSASCFTVRRANAPVRVRRAADAPVMFRIAQRGRFICVDGLEDGWGRIARNDALVGHVRLNDLDTYPPKGVERVLLRYTGKYRLVDEIAGNRIIQLSQHSFRYGTVKSRLYLEYSNIFRARERNSNELELHVVGHRFSEPTSFSSIPMVPLTEPLTEWKVRLKFGEDRLLYNGKVFVKLR